MPWKFYDLTLKELDFISKGYLNRNKDILRYNLIASFYNARWSSQKNISSSDLTEAFEHVDNLGKPEKEQSENAMINVFKKLGVKEGE